MKMVNDLKKKINVRKKFYDCSFEDFKQEDKLELLVKVLSNEEILQHLYQKIFTSRPKLNYEELSQEGLNLMSLRDLGKSEREKGRSERVVGRLPSISAMRK